MILLALLCFSNKSVMPWCQEDKASVYKKNMHPNHLIALIEAQDILRSGPVWKTSNLDRCSKKLCRGRHTCYAVQVSSRYDIINRACSGSRFRRAWIWHPQCFGPWWAQNLRWGGEGDPASSSGPAIPIRTAETTATMYWGRRYQHHGRNGRDSQSVRVMSRSATTTTWGGRSDADRLTLLLLLWVWIVLTAKWEPLKHRCERCCWWRGPWSCCCWLGVRLPAGDSEYNMWLFIKLTSSGQRQVRNVKTLI